MENKNKTIQTSSPLENTSDTLKGAISQNITSFSKGESSYIGFYDYFNTKGLYPGDLKSNWMYVELLNITERIFANLWDIKGSTPYVSKLIKNIKFNSGKVAIIKIGEDLTASDFTYDENDKDYKGEITKITLKSKFLNLDKKVLKKGNFSIIWNNELGLGTIGTLIKQIEIIVKAKIDVDNNQRITRPILWFKGRADDVRFKEFIHLLTESDTPAIPLGNVDLTDIETDFKEPQDRSDKVISTLMFQLKTYLMLLGLVINNLEGKNSEMTEIESSSGSLFRSVLLHDMDKWFNIGIEETNKVFNVKWTLDKSEDFEDMISKTKLNTNHIESDLEENERGEKDEKGKE